MTSCDRVSQEEVKIRETLLIPCRDIEVPQQNKEVQEQMYTRIVVRFENRSNSMCVLISISISVFIGRMASESFLLKAIRHQHFEVGLLI